jgi:hypothetical protein
VPLFKDKLDAYKKEFSKHELVLDEESYCELRAKPEPHLSLKEFIQLRVYEQLQVYKENMSAHQGEN